MEQAKEIKMKRRYGVHIQLNQDGAPQISFGQMEDYHLIMADRFSLNRDDHPPGTKPLLPQSHHRSH